MFLRWDRASFQLPSLHWCRAAVRSQAAPCTSSSSVWPAPFPFRIQLKRIKLKSQHLNIQLTAACDTADFPACRSVAFSDCDLSKIDTRQSHPSFTELDDWRCFFFEQQEIQSTLTLFSDTTASEWCVPLMKTVFDRGKIVACKKNINQTAKSLFFVVWPTHRINVN